VAELLARLADGRRVDDRHHLVDVIDHGPVEELLVPVLERDEVDVALRSIVGRVGLAAALNCCSSVETAGGRPFDAEAEALRLRECGPC
jgi:hypothetical protein